MADGPRPDDLILVETEDGGWLVLRAGALTHPIAGEGRLETTDVALAFAVNRAHRLAVDVWLIPRNGVSERIFVARPPAATGE